MSSAVPTHHAPSALMLCFCPTHDRRVSLAVVALQKTIGSRCPSRTRSSRGSPRIGPDARGAIRGEGSESELGVSNQEGLLPRSLENDEGGDEESQREMRTEEAMFQVKERQSALLWMVNINARDVIWSERYVVDEDSRKQIDVIQWAFKSRHGCAFQGLGGQTGTLD